MALAGVSGGAGGRREMSPSQRTGLQLRLTVLEDPLHVEPVGCAGFIVGAAFELVGQLPCSAVFDHSGVG